MPPSQGQSHAPLASLAAHWHACRGDIPPPLVGASVTLVDNPDPAKARLYLFGGRLVTTRRMVNDLYELELLTLRWHKISFDTSRPDYVQGKPQPRYFHSCNLWEGKLVVFGGMGYTEGSEADLCVLDEVIAFDLTTRAWEFNFMDTASNSSTSPLPFAPQPRYAHLASASADFLVVIGGQDMANRYVEEINVLDLQRRRWIAKLPYEKQRGSYRSLAVEPQWKIVEGEAALREAEGDQRQARASPSTSSSSSVHPMLSPDSIDMLPLSSRDWDDSGRLKPLPVYVYTNYSFTDVKREMEVVQIAADDGGGDGGAGIFDACAQVPSLTAGCQVHIDDRSGAMTGLSLPPGLRFPMGAILGQHLIISGTYLANTSQTFAIWALHLRSMTWSRLDVGPLLATGSWNRGVLWPLQSRLIVFGHRERDLVADYNHRQTNWDHVLVIDLEAWGVTQPPVQQMSLAAVRLGLQKLASSTMGSFGASLESGLGRVDEETGDPLLSLGGRGDFEIVCSDGMRLGCDRIILERRWPWFGAKMREYQRQVKMLGKSTSSPTKRGSRPSTGEQLSALLEEDERGLSQPSTAYGVLQTDPRITPRQLHISEPSPVMLALLIFLYTRSICTKVQRHPAIVAALVIVSKVYDMKDLELWAKYAAHVIMSNELAPPTSTNGAVDVATALPPLERHRFAVAIYEAATMSGLEALQIRALRTVMAIAKWVQRSSISSVDSTGERGVSPLTPTASSAAPPPVLQRNHSQTQSQAIGRGSGHSEAEALARRAPSITSPTLSRQGSYAPSANSETTDSGSTVRRIGRTDRTQSVTDGASGGGDGDPGGVAQPFFGTSSNQAGPWAATGPAHLQSRRPSAPSSLVVSTSAPPPPPSAMPPSSSQSGRKRFSIFGRGASEQNKPGQHVQLSATTVVTPTSGSSEGRTSAENAPASPFARLSRTNTGGSAGEDGARSGASGHATLLGAAASNGANGGRAPSPSAQAAEGAAKKSVINRIKSASISSGSNNSNNKIVPAEDPVSGGGGRAQGEGSGDRVGNAQLNQKDIKALQGIFA